MKIYLISLSIFVLSFTTYFFTTARHPVNIADSNELMTAAYANGIAHPPSYPLYVTLLGGLMRLPVGDPAFLASLSAAFFQSLSLAIFFLCSLELIKVIKISTSSHESVVVSVAGALILAFSYFFWDQATFAEVFGLSNIFVGLIILMVLKFINRKPSLIIWALFGVAASHHQTVLFLLPAYLYLLLKKFNHLPWLKYLLVLCIFFVLPYLWMIVGTNREASISWYFEPTVNGFLELISRSIYVKGGSAIETYVDTIDIRHSLISVGILTRHVLSHLTFPGMALSIGGLVCLYKKHKQLFIFFTLVLIVSGPLLAGYLKFPIFENTTDWLFFSGTYLRLRMFVLFEYIIALSIPIGVIYISSFHKLFTKPVIKNVFLSLIFIIPVYLLRHNFSIVDKRKSNFDNLFYGQVLETAPEKSVIIADSDLVFGLLYQQTVNKIRSDVLVIPTAMYMRWGYLQNFLPKDTFEITGYNKLILSLANWGIEENRPVFVFDPSANFIKQISQFNYLLVPHGYLLRITKIPQSIETYDYGLTYQLASLDIPHEDLWTRGNMGEIHTIHMNLAYFYNKMRGYEGAYAHLTLAEKLSQNPRNYEKFLKILKDQ